MRSRGPKSELVVRSRQKDTKTYRYSVIKHWSIGLQCNRRVDAINIHQLMHRRDNLAIFLKRDHNRRCEQFKVLVEYAVRRIKQVRDRFQVSVHRLEYAGLSLLGDLDKDRECEFRVDQSLSESLRSFRECFGCVKRSTPERGCDRFGAKRGSASHCGDLGVRQTGQWFDPGHSENELLQYDDL